MSLECHKHAGSQRWMWKEVSLGHSGHGEGLGSYAQKWDSEQSMIWWVSLRSLSHGWVETLLEVLGGIVGPGEGLSQSPVGGMKRSYSGFIGGIEPSSDVRIRQRGIKYHS